MTCSICCEDEDETEPLVTLDCGHVFHAKCAVEWFRRHHDTCPNCRSVYVRRDTVRLSPRERVGRMERLHHRLPAEVRTQLRKFYRASQSFKTLRAEWRAYRRAHRDVLKADKRLHSRMLRWGQERDRLVTLLGRTVVPGVPLAVPVPAYDSGDASDGDA